LKDEIFQKQLMTALKKKEDELAQEYEKTYAERINRDDYTVMPRAVVYQKSFTVAGDDKVKGKMWESMMTDACHYFDRPGISDEVKVRRNFQRKYDSLFSTTMRPPMQSRKDLVLWTCAAQNAWMADKERPELAMECDNYDGLLKKFGPDYTTIKKKLGYIKGLIPDDI
jgi:hypothetical protein